jgi:hypothetical protein
LPPRSLRQHVEEAERIMSINGVKTLLPTKERRAPVKVAVSNKQLIYAVSIRLVITKYDRTGYAQAFLEASDDVAGTFWQSIPDHSVCPLCLSRMPEERLGKGRQQCALCGAFVRPKVLRGLVSADLRKMATLLKLGEIPVRGERG